MSQRKGSGYAAIPSNSDVEQQPESGPSSAGQSPWRRFVNHPKVQQAHSALTHNPAATFTAGLVFALGALVFVALFLPESQSLNPFPSSKGETIVPPGISAAALEEGLNKCRQIKKARVESFADADRKNPRADKRTSDILIQNAEVWDGEGNILKNVNVLLQDGIVKAVGKDVEATNENTEVIDVKGHIVSPGLVDMHR